MSFVTVLRESYRDPWQRMLAEPFLDETARGTIPDSRFGNWLKQDYLFVRDAIPFLSLLIPKAPVAERKPLSDAMAALHQELVLFESMAQQHDIDVREIEPAPTNVGYTHFLLASGALEPYEVGFTALYTAEKAYLDSWIHVRQKQRHPSKWQAFIDHWTSETFQRWVSYLEAELGRLAETASDDLRTRMEKCFLQTLRYETLFWRMAYSGESW